MGKRSRTKNKRAAKPKVVKQKPNKPEKPKESTQHTEPPSNDISEDCVLYESPDEAEIANGVIEDASDDSGDEESSSDELRLDTTAEDDDVSEIVLDLDFFDPTPEDANAVQNFVDDLCNASGMDAEAFARAICAQSRVGTVIKAEDQHAGFITVLPAALYTELLSPLAKRIRAAGAPIKFLRAFDDKSKEDDAPKGPRVGFLFSGGMVNLPIEITPKMYEALLSEVEWATEDEPEEQLRTAFDLHWYCYVTDFYPTPTEKKDTKPPPKKKKKKPEPDTDLKNENEDDETPFSGFTKIEDEFLQSKATHTVTWPIPEEKPGEDGMVRKKMAMFIKKDKMKQAHQAIVDYFVAMQINTGDVANLDDAMDTKN